ncbi:MAG: hypothetical protein HOW73_01410 [Polyangiaceae bacterium]|nr:hypothetical protein [Polyangiaceae bacterium]
MTNPFRLLVALLVLGTTATGCNATITNGGSGEDDDTEPTCDDDAFCAPDPGDDEDPPIGSEDQDPPVPGTDGIAVPYEQLGSEVVPAPAGTLLLSFGSEAAVCADPLADLPSCQPELIWRAEIPLPAELQAAGSVVDLEDLLEVGFGPFSSESIGEGDGLCSGGGGTLTGTLEVLAVDDATITIQLAGAIGLDADPNGVHVLARCP